MADPVQQRVRVGRIKLLVSRVRAYVFPVSTLRTQQASVPHVVRSGDSASEQIVRVAGRWRSCARRSRRLGARRRCHLADTAMVAGGRHRAAGLVRSASSVTSKLRQRQLVVLEVHRLVAHGGWSPQGAERAEA